VILSQIALTILFIGMVFCIYSQRKRKKQLKEAVQRIDKLYSDCRVSRDSLAKLLLLSGLDNEKIWYKKQPPKSGVPLMYAYSDEMYGLLVSRLNDEEKALMGTVDDLFDGRIKSSGGVYKIPGTVTQEEIKRFSRN
jgi:hypothetical protein